MARHEECVDLNLWRGPTRLGRPLRCHAFLAFSRWLSPSADLRLAGRAGVCGVVSNGPQWSSMRAAHPLSLKAALVNDGVAHDLRRREVRGPRLRLRPFLAGGASSRERCSRAFPSALRT